MAVTRFCVYEDNNPGVLDSIDDRLECNLPPWFFDFSSDLIMSGHTNVEFVQLPAYLVRNRLSIASCLASMCLAMRGSDNSTTPGNRTFGVPRCVFGQTSSKTGPDPLRINFSQPDWISNRIGNIDNATKLYDHYASSPDLLCYLGSHMKGECSCWTQTNGPYRPCSPGSRSDAKTRARRNFGVGLYPCEPEWSRSFSVLRCSASCASKV